MRYSGCTLTAQKVDDDARGSHKQKAERNDQAC